MNEKKKRTNLFRDAFITRTHGFIDVSTKRHFWKELANEIGGELKIKHTVSKDIERLVLHLPYKKHIITFSESDIHPLKIECTLPAKQSFNFVISFEDSIEKLLKLFGQQDVEIGDKTFDDKYLVKGSNPEFTREILSIKEVKTNLLKNNVFLFDCIFQKEKNELVLSSLVSRTVNSKTQLAELYQLFCTTIDKMRSLSLIK